MDECMEVIASITTSRDEGGLDGCEGVTGLLSSMAQYELGLQVILSLSVNKVSNFSNVSYYSPSIESSINNNHIQSNQSIT
jgi:hypothetical protein